MITASGCPSPFNPASLSVLKDQVPPAVAFSAPSAGSAFQSAVTVTGSIIDYDGNGEPRAADAASFIASASYYLYGDEDAAAALSLSDDGAFSFSMATADLHSQITIVVAAVDKNGNAGTGSITLSPDGTGPFLVITSPDNYAEYGTAIVLSGYARDSASGTSTAELSPAVSYSLPGTAVSGTLALDATGSFTATLSLASVTGSRSIEVTASDLNGNETTVVVTVVKPDAGGDISGFSVESANKSAVIRWNPVIGAESYRVTETNSGAIVSGSSSPYTWTGLENGKLYAFQVTAVMHAASGLDDAESAEIEVLPCSIRTLAPWVEKVEYKGVTIAWRGYTDVSKHIVERSASPDGPWTRIAKTSGTSLTDSNLDTGQTYFYRVSPADYPSMASEFIAARPGRFPAPGSPGVRYADRTLTQGVGDVASADGLACVVSGSPYGMEVFDVSDPSNPASLSTMTFDYVGNVAMDGGYAYVAGYSLYVVDLSDPAHPVQVGSRALSEMSYDIAVSGDYAYICFSSGVKVVDISNKSSPFVVLTISAASEAKCIDIVGDYAYVACTETGTPSSFNGLAVIDVTVPQSASLIGTRTLSTGAQGVAVSDGHAYVADGSSGLAIVDVSDVSSAAAITAASVSYVDTLYSANDIAVSGYFAYVADIASGLAIINVADPAHPGEPEYANTQGDAQAVALVGGCALVADYGSFGIGGLALIDISYPGISGEPGRTLYSSSADYRSVAVSGGLALAVFPDNFVLDAIELDSGALASQTIVTGGLYLKPYQVAIAGERAYLSTSGQRSIGGNDPFGLAVVDMGDPAEPGAPVIYDAKVASAGIAVRGPYAYLALNNDGFGTIDVSDPEHPTDVHSCMVASTGLNVALRGDYAYVSDGPLGLSVVDVSDPANPTLVGTRLIAGAGTVEQFGPVAVREVDGRVYAYMAMAYQNTALDAGIAIVDVTEPHGIASAAVVVYGIADTDPGAVDDSALVVGGVEISGSYAFVLFGYKDGLNAKNAAVAVLDISDPDAPSLVTKIRTSAATGAYGYDLAVDGDKVHVARGPLGLEMIDLDGE